MFTHRFEYDPIDPLNQANQEWEDELESQRTRPREEPTERRGGQNYLLLPDLVSQARPPDQHIYHNDLQHQAQDSLEALDG